jgi:hypothetical protein
MKNRAIVYKLVFCLCYFTSLSCYSQDDNELKDTAYIIDMVKVRSYESNFVENSFSLLTYNLSLVKMLSNRALDIYDFYELADSLLNGYYIDITPIKINLPRNCRYTHFLNIDSIGADMNLRIELKYDKLLVRISKAIIAKCVCSTRVLTGSSIPSVKPQVMVVTDIRTIHMNDFERQRFRYFFSEWYN